MTKAVRFLPEVENDILTGYAWYDGKSPGLGEEFLRMFWACTHDLIRYPKGYQRFMVNFVGVFSEDSLMPFIIDWQEAQLLFSGYFIVFAILNLLERSYKTGKN
ncbi:hypothetical protein Desac_2404 [Desulfobacca acetoxidans DSM 11109]|uniref:Uncharacterized protein n=1 Tax=Desulfobacca acetoxidans (strain ATCC 700848 / DSM 11109 / ASRB2) TaxID=880072 RepID=F2NFV6_DESAR|nr:hypothetical protein Desac_2404 [Desulfobacca acetoxidans DSM 11109]